MPPEMGRNIQRERLLKATAEVVSRKGHAAATVRDLLGELRPSRRTYYDLCTDKEAAYLDMFSEIAVQIEQRVRAAFELLYGPLARHDTAWLRDLSGQIGDPPIVPPGRAMKTRALQPGHTVSTS